jgi:hypothetical protein
MSMEDPVASFNTNARFAAGEIARKIIAVVDASLLGTFVLTFGFGLDELLSGEPE